MKKNEILVVSDKQHSRASCRGVVTSRNRNNVWQFFKFSKSFCEGLCKPNTELPSACLLYFGARRFMRKCFKHFLLQSDVHWITSVKS